MIITEVLGMNNNQMSYNEFMNQIKCGCPVHTMDFGISMNAVAGMYLLLSHNIDDVLNKYMDKPSIKDMTLMIFESRHIVECCQVIAGALYVYTNENTDFVKKIVKHILLSLLTCSAMFPDDFDAKLNEIVDMCNNPLNDKLLNDNLKKIILNIWFVPYTNLDAIGKEGFEEYEREIKEKVSDNK